jgi:hypothetical protein
MKNPRSSALSAVKSSRPNYACLTAAEALARDWAGFHLSQKADGVCVRREWNGAAVWGDSMPDGRLMVWDIDTFRGQDIRAWDWPARDAALSEVFQNIEHRTSNIEHPNARPNWARVLDGRADLPGRLFKSPNLAAQQRRPTFQESENPIGNRQSAIGNFLARMIAFAEAHNTPDVAVAKPIAAPFGVGLVKIKLYPTHDVIVSDTSGDGMSVAIRHASGDPAGRVPVRNLQMRESLRPGDWIEISGTLLPSGKFREPRFMRTRPDKV